MTEFENKEFEKIIEGGSLDRLKELIDSGFNVIEEKTILHEKTALHLGAEKGRKEMCQLLIESGSEIDAKCCFITFFPEKSNVTERQVTPLMLASFNGHEEICQMLIKAGANVNYETKNFSLTALVLASGKGFKEICEMLIKAGADNNHISMDNTSVTAFPGVFFNHRTPLSIAIKNKHVDLAKFLISTSGINVRLLNNREEHPLYFAVEIGSLELCQALIKAGANANPDSGNLGDHTPLSKSASEGHKEICEFLIKSGAKPRSSKGLFEAASKGHKEICEMLIKAGPEFLNERAPYLGRTALHGACENGHKEVCQLLIEEKADLETSVTGLREKDLGGSAFWIAAGNGYLDICKLLLKSKADPKKCSSKGESALYIAAKFNKLEVCKFLIKKCGLDVNQTTENGKTPCFIARKKGFAKVASFLKSSGGISKRGEKNPKKKGVIISKKIKVEE